MRILTVLALICISFSTYAQNSSKTLTKTYSVKEKVIVIFIDPRSKTSISYTSEKSTVKLIRHIVSPARQSTLDNLATLNMLPVYHHLKKSGIDVFDYTVTIARVNNTDIDVATILIEITVPKGAHVILKKK